MKETPELTRNHLAKFWNPLLYLLGKLPLTLKTSFKNKKYEMPLGNNIPPEHIFCGRDFL